MKSLVIISGLLTLNVFATVQNKLCTGGSHTIKFEKVTKQLPTTLCSTGDKVDVVLNGKTIYGTNGKIAVAGESFCVLRGGTNDHEQFATENKAILECGNLAEINDRYISFVKQLVADAEDNPAKYHPAYNEGTPLNVLRTALKTVNLDIDDTVSISAFLGNRKRNGYQSNLVKKSTKYNYKQPDIVTRFLPDFEKGSWLNDKKGYRKTRIGGGYKLYRMREDTFRPIIIPPFRNYIYLNKYERGQHREIAANVDMYDLIADTKYSPVIGLKLATHKNTLEALIESKIGGLNSYEPLTPRKLSLDAKSVKSMAFVGRSICLITDSKVHCLNREDEDITKTFEIPAETSQFNEAEHKLKITSMGLCSEFLPNQRVIYDEVKKGPEGANQSGDAWNSAESLEKVDNIEDFRYIAQCIRDVETGFEETMIELDFEALFADQDFIKYDEITGILNQFSPPIDHLRKKYGQGEDDESITTESHARADQLFYRIYPGGMFNGIQASRVLMHNDLSCLVFPIRVEVVSTGELRIIGENTDRTVSLGKKMLHTSEAIFRSCQKIEDKLSDYKVLRSRKDLQFPAHFSNDQIQTSRTSEENKTMFPNAQKYINLELTGAKEGDIYKISFLDKKPKFGSFKLNYSGVKLKHYFDYPHDTSYSLTYNTATDKIGGFDYIGGYCSIDQAESASECCFGYGYNGEQKKCIYNDFSFEAIVADQVENGTEEDAETPNIDFLGEHGMACLDSQNPESEACQNSVDSVVLGTAIKLINDYFQEKITLLAEQLMELTNDPSEEANQQMLSVAINMALVEQQKEGLIAKLSALYELVTPENERDPSILEIIAEYTGGINGEGDRDLNNPTGDDNGVDSSEGSTGGEQTVDEVLDNIGEIEGELGDGSTQNVAIENVNRDQLILSQGQTGSVYNKNELLRFVFATPNLNTDQKTAIAAYLGRVWSGQGEVNSAALYQALDNPNADANSQLSREEIARLEEDMKSFVDNGNVSLWQRPATGGSNTGDSNNGGSTTGGTNDSGGSNSSGGSSNSGNDTSTGGSTDNGGSTSTGGTSGEQRLYTMNDVMALRDDMILSEVVENGVYKASFKTENFLKFVYAYPGISASKAEKVAQYIKDKFPGEVFDTQKLRTLAGIDVPEEVRMSTDQIEAMIEEIRGISSKLSPQQPLPPTSTEVMADMSRFTRWLDMSSSVVRHQLGGDYVQTYFDGDKGQTCKAWVQKHLMNPNDIVVQREYKDGMRLKYFLTNKKTEGFEQAFPEKVTIGTCIYKVKLKDEKTYSCKTGPIDFDANPFGEGSEFYPTAECHQVNLSRDGSANQATYGEVLFTLRMLVGTNARPQFWKDLSNPAINKSYNVSALSKGNRGELFTDWFKRIGIEGAIGLSRKKMQANYVAEFEKESVYVDKFKKDYPQGFKSRDYFMENNCLYRFKQKDQEPRCGVFRCDSTSQMASVEWYEPIISCNVHSAWEGKSNKRLLHKFSMYVKSDTEVAHKDTLTQSVRQPLVRKNIVGNKGESAEAYFKRLGVNFTSLGGKRKYADAGHDKEYLDMLNYVEKFKRDFPDSLRKKDAYYDTSCPYMVKFKDAQKEMVRYSSCKEPTHPGSDYFYPIIYQQSLSNWDDSTKNKVFMHDSVIIK